MKQSTQFAGCLMTLAMLGTTGAMRAQYGPPPPPPGYAQGPGGYAQGPGGYAQGPGGYAQGPGGWDAPPAEFAEAQQRGYRDGVAGAKKDYENRRPPNVNNRDEYRRPNFVPRPDRRSYRIGFERGYQTAVQHIYGPGPGGYGRR